MAEGILRDFSKGTVEVYSAGTEPTGVHPLAVVALQEMRIDISASGPSMSMSSQGRCSISWRHSAIAPVRYVLFSLAIQSGSIGVFQIPVLYRVRTRSVCKPSSRSHEN